MRVIAGSARNVPLLTVPDDGTRPILDRLKKSLFSILDSAGLLSERHVMDLYAGTGTLGIEALSRGARRCLFAELRADCVELLKKNLTKTRLVDRADVRRCEVAALLRQLAPIGPRASLPAPTPLSGQDDRDAKNVGQTSPSARLCDLILYDPPFVFSRERNTRAALESEMAHAGQLLTPQGRLVLRCEKTVEPPQPDRMDLLRHWTDGPHAFCFYAVGKNSHESGN
jgi:16S rRNA G966 N2-methylase RsmD